MKALWNWWLRTWVLWLLAALLAPSIGLTLYGVLGPDPAPAFVGSVNSPIFHRPDCPDALRSKSGNRVEFRDLDEALDSGRRPCKRCLPTPPVQREGPHPIVLTVWRSWFIPCAFDEPLLDSWLQVIEPDPALIERMKKKCDYLVSRGPISRCAAEYSPCQARCPLRRKLCQVTMPLPRRCGVRGLAGGRLHGSS